MDILTTTDYVCFDHQRIPRLGFGCWAIGGHFSADGNQLGYGVVDDDESCRSIYAAVDHGIRFFDTAAAYGAGHSERLLGEALSGEPNVFISTKIGLRFDEQIRTILGEASHIADVNEAIDDSLKRLKRDQIDLLFLHLNGLPVKQADLIFDQMDLAVSSGKIRSYGWSTDFSASASAVSTRKNFVAVQHAMNVFFAAPDLLSVIDRQGLLSISRSPLAMALLTGKYDASSVLPDDDVRSNDFDWNSSFKNGRVRPERLKRLAEICECLRVGGRTTAQGALGWLWAHSEKTVPIPGFKSVKQVEENVAALAFGALPENTMRDIEVLVDRTGENDQRER